MQCIRLWLVILWSRLHIWLQTVTFDSICVWVWLLCCVFLPLSFRIHVKRPFLLPRLSYGAIEIVLSLLHFPCSLCKQISEKSEGVWWTIGSFHASSTNGPRPTTSENYKIWRNCCPNTSVEVYKILAWYLKWFRRY